MPRNPSQLTNSPTADISGQDATNARRLTARAPSPTPPSTQEAPAGQAARDAGPLKLLFYSRGEHFQIPEDVLTAMGEPAEIPLLALAGPDGNARDGSFTAAATPEEADFIVFPYVLDTFITAIRAMAVHFFLRGLPFFVRHEHKHVFFHCHDRGQPLVTSALILTTAPDRFNVTDPFVRSLPYYPGAHVLDAAPDFIFDAIDLDTNFVGALSWPVRHTLAQSIKAEKGLSYLIRHPNTFDYQCPESSFIHVRDPARKREMAETFVSAMRRSWTTLCPRGMGASSIRFFEAMCLGRIPVHVSGANRLPFEDIIDYPRFCLFIPESEARQAGTILRTWLAKRGKDQLMAMCREARRTWEEHFRPEDAPRLCLEHLRRHLPETRKDRKPRYVEMKSPLAGESAPRLATPPGFYSGMAVDDKKLWLKMPLKVERPDGESGMVLIHGVRSRAGTDGLLRLMDLAAEAPENASIACGGEPSGILAIMAANGLVKARNFSSLVHCAENWSLERSHAPGESFPEFMDNIRRARVGHFIRPLPGRNGAEAFRGESLDMAVLTADDARALLEAIRSFLPKLTPNGRLIAVCRDAAMADALMGLLSREGEGLDARRSRTLAIIRKCGAVTGTDGTDRDAPGASGGHGMLDAMADTAGRFGGWAWESAARSPASLEDGRFLAVRATGGMGNRLLGLMCAVVHGLVTGRRLCVDWSDFMYSDRGENVFPRLFRLSGVPHAHQLPQTEDVSPEFWRPFLRKSLLVEQIGINHMDPAVMKATRVSLSGDHDHTVAAFWSFDLSPMEEALEHIRERLPRFAALDADGVCSHIMKNHILPRPIVTGRVEAFAARHFTRAVVGVHIRHTDLRMPFEKAVEAADGLRRSMGAGVFLATDNERVERDMAEIFGADLIRMPKRYPAEGKHMHSHRIPGLTNFEKALDACAEMYLLARCDAIVRYEPSSFAKISWYCSDLPAGRLVSVR